MIKKLYYVICLSIYSFAHPVSYTIELLATYDISKQEIKIDCHSSSRNKCGLHNFHILDKNGDIILTKKFPFLKKTVKVNSSIEPNIMVFFLRKTPEHLYNVSFEKF